MQARVDRARALIKLSRQNDALPDLLLAEKDSPDEPSIHFFLASVYKSQGRTAEAKQELHVYGELQRAASEAVAQQANEAIDAQERRALSGWRAGRRRWLVWVQPRWRVRKRSPRRLRRAG